MCQQYKLQFHGLVSSSEMRFDSRNLKSKHWVNIKYWRGGFLCKLYISFFFSWVRGLYYHYFLLLLGAFCITIRSSESDFVYVSFDVQHPRLQFKVLLVITDLLLLFQMHRRHDADVLIVVWPFKGRWRRAEVSCESWNFSIASLDVSALNEKWLTVISQECDVITDVSLEVQNKTQHTSRTDSRPWGVWCVFPWKKTENPVIQG